MSKQNVTLSLEPELLEKAKELAVRDHRSLSSLVSSWIDEKKKQTEQPEKKAS